MVWSLKWCVLSAGQLFCGCVSCSWCVWVVERQRPDAWRKGNISCTWYSRTFYDTQWLWKTAYIFTHHFNNLEHIATNCMSAMTHTDVTTAHHWARYAAFRGVVVHAFIRHLWLKSRLCVIPCHPCMRTCVWLLECSLFFLVSLYFFLKSFFHLFLNPTMMPDENSMEDPLCNSSFGSMVSLDYVKPDTLGVR